MLRSVRKPPSAASVEQGERLKAIREEQGLKPILVAYRLGLSTEEAYRRYERGQARIRTEQLPDIAAALEIPQGELVARLGLFEREELPQVSVDRMTDEEVEAALEQRARDPNASVSLLSAARRWQEMDAGSKRLILIAIEEGLARSEPRRRR